MKRKRRKIKGWFLIALSAAAAACIIPCFKNSDNINDSNNYVSNIKTEPTVIPKPYALHEKNKTDRLLNSKNETDILPQKSDWQLILVNSSNFLPENFEVELSEIGNGHFVDKRIYDDLSEMLDAAKEQGISPIICSSYRTNEKQTQLYDAQVQAYIEQGYSKNQAQTEAAKWVALPGTSEHETGLAVDIVSLDYQILDKKQEETAEQSWLMNNSYKYGFILRYPNEKSEITGISYEPWHYRYVGKTCAAEIFETGICLEEYLDNNE